MISIKGTESRKFTLLSLRRAVVETLSYYIVHRYHVASNITPFPMRVSGGWGKTVICCKLERGYCDSKSDQPIYDFGFIWVSLGKTQLG